MVNTLIERDLWAMKRRKKAMDKINPILNKLVDAVIDCHYNAERLYDKPEETVENYDWDTVIRKYIEVDVWDWCAMIVLNVLPSTNKKLFDGFKAVLAGYGVKEYAKKNDALSKKRKLSGEFNLFEYETYRQVNNDTTRYRVDVIFRGDLPDTCRIEYEESYEEVESDKFIVKKGKVMRIEITTKVICDEQSVLRLPQPANA